MSLPAIDTLDKPWASLQSLTPQNSVKKAKHLHGTPLQLSIRFLSHPGQEASAYFHTSTGASVCT